MRHWAAEFIGKSFADHGRGPDAFDCYGLVRAALMAATGIEMPSYAGDYVSAEERAELHSLIAGEAGSFVKIGAGKERPLDLVLFRVGRWNTHIGIVTMPGKMLHICREGRDACIESYRAGQWAPKIAGFFRHAQLAGTCATSENRPSLVA